MARKRRGCCGCSPLTMILVPIIVFVIFAGALVGGASFAYDKYGKEYTGLQLGELWNLLTSLRKADEEAIVTNPYDAEADLASFYTDFKASAYIKPECEIDVSDILTSITTAEAAEGVAQNALSNIEFDTDAIRADLATLQATPEGYPGKLLEISDKQVAAFVNDILGSLVDSVLSGQMSIGGGGSTEGGVSLAEDSGAPATTGEPLEIGGINLQDIDYDGDFVKLNQILISAPVGNKAATTLKLTLSIPVRDIVGALLDSIASSDSEELASVVGYVKYVKGIIPKLLPKVLFISMDVKPYDSSAPAGIGINNLRDEQIEKVNTLLSSLKSKGVTDFDLNELLVDINAKVVDVFTKIDSMVDLSFVDSSMQLKPISTALRLLKMTDVTEYDFVSTLKALLIVDADTIVTSPFEDNASETLIQRIKTNYAINPAYDVDVDAIVADPSGLTEIINNISFNNPQFSFESESDVMKVKVYGDELADLVASNMDTLIGGEGGSESELGSLEFTVEQLVLSHVSGNNYTISLTVSTDVRAMINDTLAADSTGTPAAEDTSAQLKQKLTETMNGLLPEQLFVSAIIHFQTDDDGNITNLVIDYENEPCGTEIALNNLTAAGTTEKLIIVQKMMNAISAGTGDQLNPDQLTQTIDKAVRDALVNITGDSSNGIEVLLGHDTEQAYLLLPSLYEVLYSQGELEGKLLDDGTPITPDTVRLALKELVAFDDTQLKLSNYTAQDGTDFITEVKTKYAINDSALLPADGYTGAEGQVVTDYQLGTTNFTNEAMMNDVANRIDLSNPDYEFLSNDEMKVMMLGKQIASVLKDEIDKQLPEDITAVIKQAYINYVSSETIGADVFDSYSIDLIIMIDMTSLDTAQPEGSDIDAGALISNIFEKNLYLTTSTQFSVKNGDMVDLAYDETNIRTDITVNKATATTSSTLSTADMMSVMNDMLAGVGAGESLNDLNIAELEKTVDKALRDAFSTLSQPDTLGAPMTFGRRITGESTVAYLELPSIYELIIGISGADTLTTDDVRLSLENIVKVNGETPRAEATVDKDPIVTDKFTDADGNAFITNLRAKYGIQSVSGETKTIEEVRLGTATISEVELQIDNFTEPELLDDLINRIDFEGLDYDSTIEQSRVDLLGKQLAAIVQKKVEETDVNGYSFVLKQMHITYDGVMSGEATYTVDLTVYIDVAASFNDPDSDTDKLIAKMFANGLYMNTRTYFTLDVATDTITNLAKYTDETEETEVMVNHADYANTLATLDTLNSLLDGFGGEGGSTEKLEASDIEKKVDDVLRDAMASLGSADGLGVNITFRNDGANTGRLSVPSIYEVVKAKSNAGDSVTADDVRLSLENIVKVNGETPRAEATVDKDPIVTNKFADADGNTFISNLRTKYGIQSVSGETKTIEEVRLGTANISEVELQIDNFTEPELLDDLINRIDFEGLDYDSTIEQSRVDLLAKQLASIVQRQVEEADVNGYALVLKQVHINYHGILSGEASYTVDLTVYIDVASKFNDPDSDTDKLMAKMCANGLYLNTRTYFTLDVATDTITNLAKYTDATEETDVLLNHADYTNTLATLDTLNSLLDGFGGEGGSTEKLEASDIEKKVDDVLRDAMASLGGADGLGVNITFRNDGADTGRLSVPSIYEVVKAKSNADASVTADDMRLTLESIVKVDSTSFATNFTATDGNNLVAELKAKYGIQNVNPAEVKTLAEYEADPYDETLNPTGVKVQFVELDVDSLNNADVQADLVNRAAVRHDNLDLPREMKVEVLGQNLASIVSDKLEGNTAIASGYALALKQVNIAQIAASEYSIQLVIMVDVKSAYAGETDNDKLVRKLFANDMYITSNSTFTIDANGNISNLVLGASDPRPTALELNSLATSVDYSTVRAFDTLNALITGFGSGGATLDLEDIQTQVDDTLRGALADMSGEDGLNADLGFDTVGTSAMLLMPSIYDLIQSNADVKATTKDGFGNSIPNSDYVSTEGIRNVLLDLYDTYPSTLQYSPDAKTSLNSFLGALNTNYYLTSDSHITEDDLFGDAGGADALYNKLDEDSVDFDTMLAAATPEDKHNYELRTMMNRTALAEAFSAKFTDGTFISADLDALELIELNLYSFDGENIRNTTYNATNPDNGKYVALHLYMRGVLNTSNSNNVLPEYIYINVYTPFYSEGDKYDGVADDWRTKVVIGDMSDAVQGDMFKIINGLADGGTILSADSLAGDIGTEINNMLSSLNENGNIAPTYEYDGDSSFAIVFPSIFDYVAKLMFKDTAPNTPDPIWSEYSLINETDRDKEMGEIVRIIMKDLSHYSYVSDYDAEVAKVETFMEGKGNSDLFGFGMNGAKVGAMMSDTAIRYAIDNIASVNPSVGSGAGISGADVQELKIIGNGADVMTKSFKKSVSDLWGASLETDGAGNATADYMHLVISVTPGVTQLDPSNDDAALLNRLLPSRLYLSALSDMSAPGTQTDILINDFVANSDEEKVLFALMNRRTSGDTFSRSGLCTSIGTFVADAVGQVEGLAKNAHAALAAVEMTAYYKDTDNTTASAWEMTAIPFSGLPTKPQYEYEGNTAGILYFEQD